MPAWMRLDAPGPTLINLGMLSLPLNSPSPQPPPPSSKAMKACFTRMDLGQSENWASV